MDREIVNEGMNLAEKQWREEGWLRWKFVEEEVLVHDGRTKKKSGSSC